MYAEFEIHRHFLKQKRIRALMNEWTQHPKEVKMNISCVSFDMDDNLNLVSRPGFVLATRGINVVNNEKQTLIDTFKEKTKKILPDAIVKDLTDEFAKQGAIHYEKDVIGVVYRNDDTKWYFEKQVQEQFKNAIMLFTYYGCWATFHWESTEKHVRAALGAWKRELYLDAKKKGLDVRRFDEATDENLGKSITKLKDDEFVMLFTNKKIASFYQRHNINTKEWPCLLISGKGQLATFDLSTSKKDVLQEHEIGDCVVCGAEHARNRCRTCEKEFMCNDCRKIVYQKFHGGKNHHCLSCQTAQPIYIQQLANFALHRPAEITDQLRNLYGPIVPLVQ